MNLKAIEQYFLPTKVLDIGANIGQFHRECRQAFPECFIYSIEANREHEGRLRALTPNFRIALFGDEDKLVPFYRNKADWVGSGNSIYKELTEHFRDENLVITQEHMVRLDDQADLVEMKFDLIKMDTQGSEIDIIKGGLDTCKRAKGILLEVSFVPYNAGAPLSGEVYAFLQKIGFSPVEVLDIHEATAQKDVLFVNNEIYGRQLG